MHRGTRRATQLHCLCLLFACKLDSLDFPVFAPSPPVPLALPQDPWETAARVLRRAAGGAGRSGRPQGHVEPEQELQAAVEFAGQAEELC